MTEYEKAFEKMTPEQRKAATEAISEMMGMPPEKKRKKKNWTEEEIAAYLEEDEIKAQERFVDQPEQWIDATPPEVKKRQAKAWKELEKSIQNKKDC